ncbi:hypothetical protein D0869_13583 [Hortaea werneckii]|uniref:Uncharacterized protein n=1 Tax=Hortaea werneckii TaxID=91943 RepID=A0A3M6W5H0_HORWE|nr:hypothetical protein KC334_g7286 [Hortaea werneckii]KAI7007915.1 hypothetical protein KC355_g7153 [Hortaea werneckii]KAI7183472.1 hypothetical protein KC324_g7947 [Hortaea werneckii]KAI7308603.1 hypothetical protein KC315_g13288 [Hortaea werneckii]KAI7368991.1 hypothetical protein KC354_g2274 [Hortaea werneckii]
MASTAPQPWFTPGRVGILLGNLAYSVGAFAADFNETHVYNPKWPPHARFHNGQTMTLGVMLSSMSLYLTARPCFTRMSKEDALRSVLHGAIVGSFYCAAGLSAIFYPGTDWKDPDIAVGGEQRFLFAGVVALMWIGYGLERWRMGSVKEKGV